MKRIAFVIAIAAAAAAQAADIYVWTDESGKTHLADSVPPQYRKSAIRIDSSQFELSPEQRRDAASARAALAKRASAASASMPAPAPAGPPPPPAAIGAAPPAATAAGASPPASDCDALQREYRESLECFAPYVNGNGSLKPGAFAACRSVVNPTLKCGSPKAY